MIQHFLPQHPMGPKVQKQLMVCYLVVERPETNTAEYREAIAEFIQPLAASMAKPRFGLLSLGYSALLRRGYDDAFWVVFDIVPTLLRLPGHPTHAIVLDARLVEVCEPHAEWGTMEVFINHRWYAMFLLIPVIFAVGVIAAVYRVLYGGG